MEITAPRPVLRRVPQLLAGLVVGAVVGATTWGVAFAVDPVDTITVCSRPGADLRAPATNGSCPSGYTKTSISDGAPATNPAYLFVGESPFTNVGESVLTGPLQLPAGSYLVHADGWLRAGTGSARVICSAGSTGETESPAIEVEHNAAVNVVDNASLSATVVLDAPGEVYVFCSLEAATDPTRVGVGWTITATQVSSVTGAD